jgi:integrase
MKLTEVKVRQAKPREKRYKLADGSGLFLLVTPGGGKLWRSKYRFAGSEKLMSFGVYPEVSLAAAREQHADARKVLRSGVDPMEQRKVEKVAANEASESFKTVALAWHESWGSNKNPDYAEDVMIRLTRDLFPSLGHLPMEQINARKIVATIKKIEQRGAREIASRCLSNVSQVFRYAIAHGLATRNPAADIKPTDFLKPVPVANMARVGVEEIPRLLRKIENYEGSVVTRLAMKIMALTFVRTSELIEGEWLEINFKKRLWTIPPERMKKVHGAIGMTPHFVPLATQTADLLESLHEITGEGRFMFPHQWDKNNTMSKNTILEALYRMGYKGMMTGHGFRGVASTVLHELRSKHGFLHEHIELQLAHVKRDDVSAAYDYSAYMAERTKMMQWWADYLDKARQKRPSTSHLAIAR